MAAVQPARLAQVAAFASPAPDRVRRGHVPQQPGACGAARDFVLYAGYRYGWDARTVGLTLGVIGACSAVVQGTLVAPLVHRFGERRILITGLLLGALGFAMYGVAPTGTFSSLQCR